MVNPPGPKLSVRIETWPIAGQFTISRGAKTEAKVVVAELSHGGFPNRVLGRGECVPYARYGESVEAVAALLEGLAGQVAQGLTRVLLQSAMPAGAARNALDCAFWDLEAKQAGKPVHRARRVALPSCADNGLHDLARHAGRHGRRRAQSCFSASSQNQARFGRRSGARRCHPCGGPEHATDCRCE